MVQITKLLFRMNKYLQFSLLFFCAMTFFTYSNADTIRRFDEFEGNHLAIIRNVNADKSIVVYKSKEDNIRLSKYKISPNSKYIAIIETIQNMVGSGNNYTRPRNQLIICNLEGKVLNLIRDNVRRFSWSPDDSKIVYLTGTYREGGQGFKPNDLIIYNLADSSKIFIKKDFPYQSSKEYSGPGWDVNWAVHDGNIYVRESECCGGNYMYDTKSMTTRQVSYKGIYFSPDGKYYLDPEPELCVCLFESATNMDMTNEALQIIPSIPYSWIPERKHHMLSGEVIYSDYSLLGENNDSILIFSIDKRQIIEKKFYIYDVEKREIVEEWVEKP